MSIGDAFVYSLMGIAIVFFALILLMIIIKLLNFAVGKHKAVNSVSSNEHMSARATELSGATNFSGTAGSSETTNEAATEKDPALLSPAKGTAGELKLYDTDPRDAAMVMAIVADTIGKPLNELRFISIREIRQ